MSNFSSNMNCYTLLTLLRFHNYSASNELEAMDILKLDVFLLLK